MSGPSLAEEVGRWIVRHELRRRLPHHAHVGPARDLRTPPTVLVARVLPADVLDRRRRFLEAAGWWPAPGSVVDPDDLPVPPEAGLVDRVAVLRAAGAVVARDATTAALAAALGVEAQGTAPPAVTAAAVDLELDAVADAIDPAWRTRPRPVAPVFSRVEALTAQGDVLFGRARRPSAGGVARRAVRSAGVVKRRFLG